MARRPVWRIRRILWVMFIFWMGFLTGSFFVIRQVRIMMEGNGNMGAAKAPEYRTETVIRTDAPGEERKAVYETLLVNAQNPLEGYVPELAPVELGYELEVQAAEALKEMLEDGRAVGYNLKICSAYRTQEKQTKLFRKKTREYLSRGMGLAEAETEAAKTVARPGTSEHESGFAVDLVSEGYQMLDEQQECTPEQQWLMKHCSEYGFILRYPTGKAEVTGVIYEPWHYRYVGKEVAKELTEKGICLEEYLDGTDGGGME